MQRKIEIRAMRKRPKSKLVVRGRQLKAVLSRCRVDANAVRVYYDDSEGFVVVAEGGAVKRVRYIFKNFEQAYDAATKTFSLRQHKYFD
jgi:hypothetical protein